jgi:hypothetical protein
MLKKYTLMLFIIALSIQLRAQEKYVLNGTVKEKNGEVLPGASVYVSGFKIATSTTETGQFNLNLPSGNYDLLIKMIGFKSYNNSIVIGNQNMKVDFILEENNISLNEVVVRPDPDREKYISFFLDFFIGTTPNAKQCKVLNPSVLNVFYDKDEKVLNVDCSEFLEIENRALGYKIKYLINDFKYNYRTNIVYYEGYPYFEDLKGSNSRQERWAKAREIAYYGSTQHFFKSLYKEISFVDGFRLYKLKRVDRISESELSPSSTDRKQLTLKKSNGKDSLIFLKSDQNFKKQINLLDTSLISTDTLVHTYNSFIKYLNFENILIVDYTLEKLNQNTPENYRSNLSALPQFRSHQISLINMLVKPIYFYQNGTVYNPRSMLFENNWAWEKVADSVPIDYLPKKNNSN